MIAIVFRLFWIAVPYVRSSLASLRNDTSMREAGCNPRRVAKEISVRSRSDCRRVFESGEYSAKERCVSVPKIGLRRTLRGDIRSRRSLSSIDDGSFEAKMVVSCLQWPSSNTLHQPKN